MSARTAAAYQEAQALTDGWLEKDIARGEIAQALQNLTLSVQARWQNFIYAQPRENPRVLLKAAESLLCRGDALADRLPAEAAAKAKGGLAQLRGMVFSAQRRPDEPEASYRLAVEHYDRGGFAMEAANSRYLVGVIRLNAAVDALRSGAQKTFVAHFDESERHLIAALNYYAGAEMRLEATKTRYMLALLYKNALSGAPSDMVLRMRQVALQHLAQGFDDLNSARREYETGDSSDTRTGKLTFAEETSKLVELALGLTTFWPGDEALAWLWTQYGKSRALADMLGAFATPPQSALAPILAEPETEALLREST